MSESKSIKPINGVANKFLAMHGVKQQQIPSAFAIGHLKQDEMNKLRKIKGKIDGFKDKAQNNLENAETSKIRKVSKYKLNIDTDSEDSMDMIKNTNNPIYGNSNTSQQTTKNPTNKLKILQQTNSKDNIINNDSNASPKIMPLGSNNSTLNSNKPSTIVKGYLDAQVTLGAEQTKAKLNAQLLFGNGQDVAQAGGINGVTSKERQSFLGNNNINKKLQQGTVNPSERTLDKVNLPLSSQAAPGGSIQQQQQQLPYGHTTSIVYNPSGTLINQGTSLSNYQDARNFNINNINLNSLTTKQLQQQYLKMQQSSQQQQSSSFLPLQPNSQQSNSSYMDDTEECVFLKGLSQNQALDANCELQEYIENEKMVVSIKTTDFFTFIRLEDEVDELKRKHQDFQQHKEQITQTVQKQQMNKFNQHLQGLQDQQFNEMDKSPSRRAANLRVNSGNPVSFPLQMSTALLKSTQVNDNDDNNKNNNNKLDEEEEGGEESKKETKQTEGANDFFAVFQAKKFGNILKNRIIANLRQRNYLASVSAKAVNDLKEQQQNSIDSNGSMDSSMDENRLHQNGSEKDNKKEGLLSKSSLLRAAMQRQSGIAQIDENNNIKQLNKNV